MFFLLVSPVRLEATKMAQRQERRLQGLARSVVPDHP